MGTWARGYSAIADDLSGAAETAAALAGATGRPASVVLAGDGAVDAAPGEIRCVDLHLRGPGRSEVRERMTSAVANAGNRLFMKIDSLYRGDLAGYASALSGGVTIVAPSLPALGRTLVDGRPLVGGVAIAESPAAATWAHEPGSPPRQVSDILDDDHEVIPLRLIRGEGLVGALAATRPRIAVCDGVTDEDLDAIVAASWHLPGVRYLGSGGLAGAIGRKLAGEDGPAIPDAPPAGAAARVLVVVGSAEASARTQLAHLAQSGVPVITVPVITAPVDDEPGSVNETCDRVAAAMGQSETVALTVPSEAIAGGAERIARSLARTVAASLARLDGGSAGNSAGG